MVSFDRLWLRNLHQVADPRTVIFAPVCLVQERMTRLTRLDADTGEAMWGARVDNSWGWLRTSASKVFYLNQHTLLQCFDLSTGTPLWNLELGGPLETFGNVVPIGDRVVVGGWRAYTRVQCLDARAGERLWMLSDLNNVREPIAGPWGLAVPRLKPPPGDLTIVDVETGDSLDRWLLPPGTMDCDSYSSVQRYEDELLITTAQGEVYLLDPMRDQTPRLIGVHKPGIASSKPTVLGTTMIFQDADRAICVYDLSAGRLVWSAHVVPHLDWRICRIQATRLGGGEILIGTVDGRLRAFDPEGYEIGAKKVGTRIMTDVVALGPHHVMFGTKGAIVTYRIM